MKSSGAHDTTQLERQEDLLFLAAAHDVLKLISSAFPDGRLPTKRRMRKIITGNQVKEENIEELSNINFYRDISGWSKNYSVLESLSNYLTFMFENKFIDLPEFSDEKGRKLDYDLEQTVRAYVSGSEALVVYPIIDIFQRKLKIECTENELIESYRKYINPRKSKSIKVIMNTPLIGFESKIENFIISDEFSIEIFSDQHKNAYILSDFDLINGYTLGEIRSSTHMIRWDTVIQRGNPHPLHHEKHLYLLIMSLRFCLSSDVVAKFSYSEPIDLISIVGVSGKWHFETSKPWQFYESSEFTESDLQKVKSLFTNLLRLENVSGYKNIFNVVVNRYLSSLSRTSPEDSVIDFTICLESLLLANERDELKFRLALRGANLLENEDPMGIKRTLNNMYDDRSAIVHSGKTLNELRRADSGSTIKEYRSVTEKIIRAYIEKSGGFESINKINEYLDGLCLFAAKSANQTLAE